MDFLESILGVSSTALLTAVERRPEIKPILIPRVAMAWVRNNQQFDGPIPGTIATEINFKKIESGYVGYCKFEDCEVVFKNSELEYVAATISHVLGNTSLAKTEVDAVVLNKFCKVIDNVLAKAISDIPAGTKEGKATDYSNIISPALRGRGYKITVEDNGTDLQANVWHQGEAVGSLISNIQKHPSGKKLEVELADLNDEHRKKGLGTAMYEAAFKHAHSKGVRVVGGGNHSTSADTVHKKLAEKHGWSFEPSPRADKQAASIGDYDEKFSPYEYAIKGELAKKALDPSEGYQFSHRVTPFSNGNLVHVDVHDKNNNHVANAKFWHNKNSLKPASVVVDEDHQRKGIASAMYGHAEKIMNTKVEPAENQTEEGAALWAGNSKNKQFGKFEMPGNAQPPKPPTAAIPPMDASRKKTKQGPSPKPPKMPKPTQPSIPSTPKNPVGSLTPKT